MASNIAESLFGTITSDEKLYKPLLWNDGEYGEKLDTAYSDMGINLEQKQLIDGIIMDISYISEQHGFEQGLKLGLKLAFELFGNT
ncbi:MAG: hypothetical protein ACI4WS_03480 [Oscillospiraceae bacterium]